MSGSRYLALFGGGFVLVNVFIWAVAFSHWRDYGRLVREGVRVEGHVMALEPENHNSMTYVYSVGWQSFTGRSSVNLAGLSSEAELKIGDKIPVSYWPGDPSISLPGDPKGAYESWSGLLFLVAPFFGVIAGSAVVWQIRRAERRRRR